MSSSSTNISDPDGATVDLQSQTGIQTAHPVIPVPYTMLIAERRLEGRGLSLMGGGAAGLLDPALDGQTSLAIFQFPFDGFVVAFYAKVRLSFPNGAEAGEVIFSYVDPAGAHLPQLRHLLNAYIAGDLITLGSVLSPSIDAKHKPNARADEGMNIGQKIAQVARFGVVLTLTLALVGLAAYTVQSRLLTSLENRPAMVMQQSTTMRAPVSGQIDFINTDATLGDIAFALVASTGTTLSYRMPCDCTLVPLLTDGATVLAGEPVATLTTPDDEIVVNASLSIEGISAALAGHRIELVFSNGQIVEAALPPNLNFYDFNERDLVQMQLVPAVPLSADEIGQLVTVRLRQSIGEIGFIGTLIDWANLAPD